MQGEALAFAQWIFQQASTVSLAATAFWTGLGFFSGAIAAARLHRANLVKSHNFAAISELTQSSSQAAAYSKVLRFMANHPAQQVPFADITKNAEIEEHAVVILGMYQFLAVAVEKGFVDRKLVRKQFVPSMRTTVSKLYPLIKHYRVELNRPRMWSELENFVAREGYRWRLAAWMMRRWSGT